MLRTPPQLYDDFEAGLLTREQLHAAMAFHARTVIEEVIEAHENPLAAWWEASKAQPVAIGMADTIKGWSGVVDDTGADVEYSAEALQRFIGNSHTRGQELLRAYLRELTESRLKN